MDARCKFLLDEIQTNHALIVSALDGDHYWVVDEAADGSFGFNIHRTEHLYLYLLGFYHGIKSPLDHIST